MKKRGTASKTGAIITLSDPSVAEMLSTLGYDWLLLDMEHSALTLEQIQKLLQAVRPECSTIVRIPANEDVWIKRVLDLGSHGIMVPMVNKAVEALEAVRSAHYPPTGKRSVGICRGQGYGQTFREYLETANEKVQLLLQIEHIQAVSNIDEILTVEGVDGLFIGPYDLSASMGFPGQIQHPRVQEAIETVKEACRAANMPWGIFSGDPAEIKKQVSEGCSWALNSIDSLMLQETARSYLREIRGSNKT